MLQTDTPSVSHHHFLPQTSQLAWLLGLLLGLLLATCCAACGTLATSPSWVGGGMAHSGPLRLEREEAEDKRERSRIARQPKKVGARHILVMHKDSERRPKKLTRSRDEARTRAKAALLRVRSGEDFVKLVKEYSDEPGATERAGDLGVFKRNVMVKAFADAVFDLKVGEVSEIVETDFGFHIIQRTR